MRKRTIAVLVTVFVIFGTIGLMGCGSDSSDAEPLVVTGTWRITAAGYPVLTVVLTHSGTALTGTVSDSLNYSRTVTGSTTAAAGATEPRNITLVVTFSDGLVNTLTGTVSDNNASMSGRYNDSGGDSDTWTGARQ